MKPVDHDEEKALIDRAKKGDGKAWDELVRRYRDPLDRMIFRFGVRTVEDRYDVAQNVWIKVYKSLRNFRGTAKFTTWLYRIAKNCSFDYLSSIPPMVQDEKSESEEEPQPKREPRDESTSAAERDYIFKIIVKKWLEEFQPAEHRETLLLHFVDGRGTTEIARMINESPQAVNNRIARALQKLQNDMQ